MQRYWLTLFIIALGISTIPTKLHAEPIAHIYSVQGKVEFKRDASTAWQPASRGAALHPGDAIRTNENSRSGIRFDDGYLLRMREKTTLRLTKDNTVNINKGSSYFFSREPKTFPNITTPQVSASVRGTEFIVQVRNKETEVSVLEGAVQLKNLNSSLRLTSAERALATRDSMLSKQTLINPLDAVQWTLSYPTTLNLEDLNKIKPTGVKEKLLKSAKLLSAGEAAQALSLLDSIKLHDNPRLEALILSQKAVVLLAQNDKKLARDLALEALRIYPESPQASFAMSFVEQAHFNLERAEYWLERTNTHMGNNIQVLARMAELALGFGDTDRALEILTNASKASKSASKLISNNSYLECVYGFAELTRYNTEQANQRFLKAIELDQTYSLAYLGLGLSTIRQGNLRSGRELLEKAVHLDPYVAAYRSYLGKAYFEESNSKLSRKEYARAISLDPNDPTPYLYRSYLHLAEHRPVEALLDIENSIALNDKRAVFRSSLLLDQDQSVRSIGLGNTFRKLGFTELARLEALKALNKDYSNYSAHFLLSDAHRGEEFSLQASNSEKFIGQLLVPVTYNAIIPGGSGDASLNEYTTLFDRPVLRKRIINESRSDLEQVATGFSVQGAEQNYGYYAEYGFIYENGLNNRAKDRLHSLGAGGQYQLADYTTLLWTLGGAASQTDTDSANTPVIDTLVDVHTEFDAEDLEASIAAHHRFGPGLHYMGQMNYAHLTVDSSSLNSLSRVNSVGNLADLQQGFGFPVVSLINEEYERLGGFLETDHQFIFDSDLLSFVLGGRVQYRTEKSDGVGTINRIIDASGFAGQELVDIFTNLELRTEVNDYLGSQAGYLYSTWHLTDWADVNLGMAYNRIEFNPSNLKPPFADHTQTKGGWKPKVGATISLPTDTIIRTAYFKALGRATKGDINLLEPTFVGGFNQVFDLFLAAEAELYGLGVDQKFSRHLYAGTEFEHRKVGQNNFQQFSILAIDESNGDLLEFVNLFSSEHKFEEDRLRAYVYSILTNQLTATADLAHFGVKFMAHGQKVETERLRLRLKYFDPSGLFLFGGADWRQQETTSAAESTPEVFWLFRAGAGLEFPNRQGTLIFSLENLLDKSFRYTPMRGEAFFVPEIHAKLNFSYNF